MQKIKHFFSTLTTKKVLFIIVLVGVLVFSNSLFNGFIGDDNQQIVDNPSVHSIKNIPSFFSGSTYYSGGAEKLTGAYYRPLMMSAFSLVYKLFGGSPVGFHLVQILLHILNVALLFLFFCFFFKKPVALFLSIIFLIHPGSSEAVFSVSSYQDVLFFLFGMLALLLLTKYQSIKSVLLVAILLLLSLLSKESGSIFVLVSALYVFLFQRKLICPFLGFSVLSVILYLFLKVHAVGLLGIAANSPIAGLNLSGRMVNIPEIAWFYLRTFLFPLSLASSYHWVVRSIGLDHFILPLILDLFIFGMIGYFGFTVHKRSIELFKIYIIFLSWFGIGLLLHLQIFPLDATVADRWLYFPIVGLLGMIGVLLTVFKFNFGKRLNIIILITILLFLSARTVVRSFDWRSEFILDTRDIRVSKEAFDLENLLGLELMKLGNFDEAKVHLERSVGIYPFSTNYNNLGLLYLNLGDYPKAKEAYLNALKFGDYYVSYENLAGLAMVYGDVKQNIAFIREALIKYPENARMWTFLAVLEYKDGDLESARSAITKAWEFNPDTSVSYIYGKIMNNKPLDLDFVTKPK